jgi:hypothetical protein
MSFASISPLYRFYSFEDVSKHDLQYAGMAPQIKYREALYMQFAEPYYTESTTLKYSPR